MANVYLVGQTSPPAPSSTAMTIDVIGHQWWWEVRYPGKPDGSGAAQSGEAGNREPDDSRAARSRREAERAAGARACPRP